MNKRNWRLLFVVCLLILVAIVFYKAKYEKPQEVLTEWSEHDALEDPTGLDLNLPGQAIAVLGNSEPKEDFFIEFRLDKERMRASEIEVLEGIMDCKDATEQNKAEAVSIMLELVQTAEMELNVERLVEAKGFGSSACCISDDSAVVVVEDQDLEENDVLQMMDIVNKVSGIPIEQVVIIPLK